MNWKMDIMEMSYTWVHWMRNVMFNTLDISILLVIIYIHSLLLNQLMFLNAVILGFTIYQGLLEVLRFTS